MIGFNGGLIGGLATDRDTSLLSAVGVWTLNEQRNAKLAGLWPVTATQVNATGGDVSITPDGMYKVHTFTSSGPFIVTTGGSVEYLVIGAGGGSGGEYSGAGGAGGYRCSVPGESSGGGASAESELIVIETTYSITNIDCDVV